MYQTYKPHRENRTVGVSAAIIVTGLAALGFSSGLARDLIMPAEPETVFTIIDAPDNDTQPTEVIEPVVDDFEFKPKETEPVVVIPDAFDFSVTDTAIAVDPTPAETPTPVVSGSRSVGPKLIVTRKPTYPPPSIRAQEQGVTTISVCVNERGRTQSAQLASSSGHSRLDDAALKWMKNARFRPARMGGNPRAVCGHLISYEWKLEDAR